MRRETWENANRLSAEGLSIHAIARRLGVHRRTVRKALDSVQPPRRGGGKPRQSLLDPHRGWLLARLSQLPELTSAALHRQLAERGFTGSYSLVKSYVAELRPRSRKAYLSLCFAPGECAQVDWGEWKSLDVGHGKRRLSFFVMVLCHSRMLYAEFFLGQGLEFWLQAHRNAFEAFGGVPERIMVDNCKTAVLNPRRNGEPAQFNPAYEDFARHYGFRITACTPGRPNEKGRVENAVGYIKGDFLAARQDGRPEVLNPALFDWTGRVANQRIHGTTGRRPAELFAEEERNALRPLPAGPHECSTTRIVAANSRFRVHVDDNRYSVPSTMASRKLQVQLLVDRIVVRSLTGELLADHPRCFARKQDIVDPDHERALLAAMHFARDRDRLTHFLALGSDAEAYLAGLREKRPAWRKHVDRINALADIHGRDAIARALSDARSYDAFSADYVHNILEMRNREQPKIGHLHVTRREDLLQLRLPEPDLSIYEREQP
jgi:transposase